MRKLFYIICIVLLVGSTVAELEIGFDDEGLPQVEIERPTITNFWKLIDGNTLTPINAIYALEIYGDLMAHGDFYIDGDIFTINGTEYNGSFNPTLDDMFGIGNLTARWKSLIIGTGDSSFAGNVGIGTTEPDAKLDIAGTIDQTHQALIITGTQSAGQNDGSIVKIIRAVSSKQTSQMLLIDNLDGSGADKLGAGIKITTVAGGAIDGMLTGIDVSDSDIVNYAIDIGGNIIKGTSLSIDGDGNVGIGTVSPTHKLNVDGKINITLNATFEKDVIIDGTLYGGSPVKIAGINITNDVFMLEENLNASSRFTLKNINSGTNATAIISSINDVGGSMSIGIGSSNFMIGSTDYKNTTALFSKSRGNMVFANFFNQAFTWLYNPQDDNDPNNLVELMRLDETGLNLSTGSIFLGDFQTSAVGGSKVVKRSNANGALFGISNPIAGANPTSGAGYITIQDCGNYTVDAHSSLDTNNPNGVVHHLRGCLVDENWRLNPDNVSSSFDFEDGVNNELFKINRTSTFIFDNFTIGSSANPINVTMFSPDGTAYSCGVANGGSFSCS